MSARRHGTRSGDRFSDGSPFEPVAGYSRAARRGTRIAVSGTTARGTAEAGDTYEQALDCLKRVIAAVAALGGHREDIVRTRVYLAPGADWRQASQAHLEALGDVAPANTMLSVASLVGEGLLVEVEADAEIESDTDLRADLHDEAALEGGEV